MKITKVFTKYDKPFLQINVPIFPDIVAKPVDLCSTPELHFDFVKLKPESVEAGIEGAYFITYSEDGYKYRIENSTHLANCIAASQYREEHGNG